MTDHEHEWIDQTDDEYYCFPCKKCDEVLWNDEIVIILNEHAKLEAKLQERDNALKSSVNIINQLEAELDKWRNWKPDDEDLADMQQQALARDGTYTNSLAAGHVYMRGLESRQRELEAENEKLKQYAMHRIGCEEWEGRVCDCGLDALADTEE